MRRFWVLVRKELDLEAAARDGLPLALGFSLVCLLSLDFGLAPGQAAAPEFACAGLWISVLFSSVLVFNRGFLREREGGAILGLALSPADPGTVYLAKVAGGFLSVAILLGATLLAAGLFMNAPVGNLGPASWAGLALGALGLSGLGTLQAAMAVHVRARDAVLPLLLFPLEVPVLILGGRILLAGLSGAGGGEAPFVAALALFDILFLGTGWLVFGFLMED